LRYPHWQEPLQAAILEFNAQSLREKLQRLEGLMAARFQELPSDSNGDSERRALSDGFTLISMLKKQRLN